MKLIEYSVNNNCDSQLVNAASWQRYCQLSSHTFTVVLSQQTLGSTWNEKNMNEQT